MQEPSCALRALLFEAVTHGRSRCYIVFVNDGSKSIAPADYVLSKLILRSLLFKLPLQAQHSAEAFCQVALVQFASNVVVEQTLTSSRHALASALDRSTQLNSNTDTTRALATAQSLLQVEPGAVKIVVLVTDGSPDDPATAIDKATELKAKLGAHIYVIGIGSRVNATHIRESASDGLWKCIPSYAEFDRIVAGFPSQPDVPPSLCAGRRTLEGVKLLLSAKNATHVVVEYMLSTDNMQLKHSEQLPMHDKDMIDFTLVAPPTCKIEARVKATFKGGVTHTSEWIQTATMTDTKETRIARNPQLLTESIARSNEKLRAFDIKQAVLKANPRLQERKGFDGLGRIRIALLGPAGVGKSASACTINACTVNEFQPFRTTRDSDESVSSDVYIQPLFELNENIEVIDLWGYTPLRPYSNWLLRRLCSGNIDHGYTYAQAVQEKEDKHWIARPTLNDQVHAVVLYTSFHLLTDSGAVSELKDVYVMLQSMSYQCIVVVTKADCVDSDHISEGKAHNAFTSQRIEDLLQRLSDTCKIGRKYILPVVNFIGEYKSEEEEPGIHYMAHRLLGHALNQAVSFVGNQLRGMPVVHQASEAPSFPSSPVHPHPSGYSPSSTTYSSSPSPQQRQLLSVPRSEPIRVTLRRSGRNRGGELVELPASMQELYALATTELEIDIDKEGPITTVRNVETGARISRLTLIDNQQILHCLTAAEEKNTKDDKGN
eukprot:TRINITY_DN966_c0_g1_i1.p1 TRINITY_DN966_c0_g1~~TRINITY_DN966_c0_g1_i1.p1  ORF type:complete len:718 (-),score=70.94 TRINITY_DN966_c0_g1_i1:54-2207(-)